MKTPLLIPNLYSNTCFRTDRDRHYFHKSWIDFKVLAAGAIPVAEGLKSAFASGADFICLGMFDFQVKQDVELTLKSIAESKHRKRPWIA